MPPPVPTPSEFQTCSSLILPAATSMTVPPQPTTYGLEAGKSTCACPSFSPSVARLSPDAANTVTPRCAASRRAAAMTRRPCPPGFGRAPADRDHGRPVLLVVHRPRYGIGEALRRVRREIDGDRRARG